MTFEYEPHWIYHNFNTIPLHIIPVCHDCGMPMYEVDYDAADGYDYELQQLFEDEGIELEGRYFNFMCSYLQCDCDESGTGFTTYDGIRWYFNHDYDCIPAVLERPDQQRSRRYLELCYKQENDYGQKTLPGFPLIDFDAFLQQKQSNPE